MTPTMPMTETAYRAAVDRYLEDALGPEYRAGQGQLRNDHWRFMVVCQRFDMERIPAVGGISVDAVTGQVQALTTEQLREMSEAGAVQAAQARQELARDEAGYVLRRHARIKANVWISDRVGLKVRVEGGTFIPLKPPVWRFSIYYHNLGPLAVLDVNAKTGQIHPLTTEQLQAIQEDVCAVRQFQTLATAA